VDPVDIVVGLFGWAYAAKKSPEALGESEDILFTADKAARTSKLRSFDCRDRRFAVGRGSVGGDRV
jgi:hypothetical protein